MKKLLIILPFLSMLTACVKDEGVAEGPKGYASAVIYTVSSTDGETYTSGDEIGFAEFTFQNGATSLEVTLNNMTPGSSHAMHLHMGTLETPGHHWNQNVFTPFCNARSMGKVWAKPFAGDVGNIDIEEDGKGTFTLQTDLWSIDTDEDSDIIGTVLFIHENSEDFLNECDPNHDHQHGHTNSKIAGGELVALIGHIPGS